MARRWLNNRALYEASGLEGTRAEFLLIQAATWKFLRGDLFAGRSRLNALG